MIAHKASRPLAQPRSKVPPMSTSPLLGQFKHLCCIVLSASLGASALCAVALANPQSDGHRKTPAQLTTPAPAIRAAQCNSKKEAARRCDGKCTGWLQWEPPAYQDCVNECMHN